MDGLIHFFQRFDFYADKHTARRDCTRLFQEIGEFDAGFGAEVVVFDENAVEETEAVILSPAGPDRIALDRKSVV